MRSTVRGTMRIAMTITIAATVMATSATIGIVDTMRVVATTGSGTPTAVVITMATGVEVIETELSMLRRIAIR